MLSIYQWFLGRLYTLRTEHERGAAAVEYGLLVALIAAAIMGAVFALGQGVKGVFCDVVTKLGFGAC